METRKYQIIRDDEHKIEYEGKTLYRIQALRDVSTRVKAGDMGGYIENYDNLSQVNECWVGGNAQVFDLAVVKDNALIMDHSEISDDSVIGTDVIVCGISHIRGKSVIISTSYEDKNIRIMGLDLNDHVRINSFKDFIMVHNVANKYDILAYHKAIPNPKDVNPEDFAKTLKNEDFVKISVQKLFPLHAIEFEGTFSEYLQWANKEPNPITSDTYMEYIAVAQLINYRFKKIFLQQ